MLEKLAKNASTMGRTIEDARQRTRVVNRKLLSMEAPTQQVAEGLLELGAISTDEDDSAG